ncbi:MAG TPA: hypothetical protein VK358_05095 [Longimicrobium sp.]|nr:hypothetical protein [Longimicrobium sp.]
MRGMRRWMAGALVAAMAACGAPAGGAPVGGGSSRVISEAEITQNTAANVLDLVQQLRPSWLQPRAGGGFPTVYVGSQALGPVERLRELATDNVREVRWMNGPEASSRFGAGVPYGVIQVILDIGG